MIFFTKPKKFKWQWFDNSICEKDLTNCDLSQPVKESAILYLINKGLLSKSEKLIVSFCFDKNPCLVLDTFLKMRETGRKTEMLKDD